MRCASSGENDRVVAALVELAQACVHVAAKRLDHEPRVARTQLAFAPQAGSADARARRHRRKRRVRVGDEGVARVFALGDCGQHEARGELRRHVLHRMHRNVRARVGERPFELLDEKPLAADLG